MEQLLASCKEQLLRPSKEAKRKLLITLNLLYILFALFFLTSEKAAEGQATPTEYLFYFVYIPALSINLISALYNLMALQLKDLKSSLNGSAYRSWFISHKPLLDQITTWASVLVVMYMSVNNMMGMGNPSNDAVITDYALAHSLILVAYVLIGRVPAFAWFALVVGILCFNINKHGWDYRFHYLTPTEAQEYEVGLSENQPWALERESELAANGLNPPRFTRYFNTWMIFIISSLAIAYFFSGITVNILKIIPPVVNKIEQAISDSIKINRELDQKQQEVTKSGVRILRDDEIFQKVNHEIDKLDYRDKEKLRPIIKLIREEINKELDWESFKINFDSVHNGFFKIIEKKFHTLTATEKRHLAFIRMRLNNLEISRLLDVKLESLRSLRYRLKKKMELPSNVNLSDYIFEI